MIPNANKISLYPPGLTESEKEEFEERISIIQFDGNMDREAAEREALEVIHKKRKNEHIEKLIQREKFQDARDILSFRQKDEFKDALDIYEYLLEMGLNNTSIDTFFPTEDGQAEAAKFYFHSMIRHTGGRGWLAYDSMDGVYRFDIGGELLRSCLRKLAKERYNRINYDNSKKDVRYAEKAITYHGIKQVEGLLKTSLTALDKAFDNAHELLNCQGETYNLRNGKHGPSTPEHMHTKTTGFRPEEGDCPVFKKFLDEVTLGDKELAGWIMRWFGYNLTGDTRAAYFVNFHGSGRNGKGTLLHVMRQIMGSYADELDPDIIVDNKRGNIKNAIANLVSLRAGFAADVPDGNLNIKVILKITGGDELTGEHKYKNPFTFRPVVKFTFSSNPILRLPATGQAIKSRLRYVPFRFSAAGKEDTSLEDRILKEAPQILAWLIREAGEYLKNPGPRGFPPCKIIEEETAEYIKSEDIIGQFLEECTEEAPYEQIQASALYEKYKEWSYFRKDKNTMSNTAFGRRLKERGLEKVRDLYGNWYKNIKLK